MKWVVVLFMIIVLISSVSAWNISNVECGNNATEFGEECDPPGNTCYTKAYTEGTCDFECNCAEYIIEVCGNNVLEDNEECEKDDQCPMFNYCNANCECIPKIAPTVEKNKTEKSTETTGTDKETATESETTQEETEYEDVVINQSYFERENFNESFGIKITGAVTRVTKGIFGSLFDLIKRWFL